MSQKSHWWDRSSLALTKQWMIHCVERVVLQLNCMFCYQVFRKSKAVFWSNVHSTTLAFLFNPYKFRLCIKGEICQLHEVSWQKKFLNEIQKEYARIVVAIVPVLGTAWNQHQGVLLNLDSCLYRGRFYDCMIFNKEISK